MCPRSEAKLQKYIILIIMLLKKIRPTCFRRIRKYFWLYATV
jgi:hypothetical protein